MDSFMVQILHWHFARKCRRWRLTIRSLFLHLRYGLCPDKVLQQCSMELSFCCMTQFETVPGVVVTSPTAGAIWPLLAPPWCLNICSVSSLSHHQTSPFSASREQPFLLSLWFYGGEHRLLSLCSLPVLPCPQLPSRGSNGCARRTDVVAHIQATAVLAERPL